MGLIIQRIEPNGRVYRDARMRVGDRIVEINGTSLIGIDFKSAQIILRDAIQQSNDLARNVSLEFKLVRSQSNLNVEQQYASEQQERPEYEAYDEEQEEINERPIEIEPIGQQIDGENEDSYENNKENNTVANTNNNMSFNHLSSINMKGKLPRILHGGGKLSMRSRIQCIVKSTFSETRLVPGPMIKSLSFCAPSIR